MVKELQQAAEKAYFFVSMKREDSHWLEKSMFNEQKDIWRQGNTIGDSW